MLATGNAEQLGICIDFCESSFAEIDGIVVIFGTPGLAPVFDVYEVLHHKMRSGTKPIFPVLPSVTTAREEVEAFLALGHINFPDEVVFGEALTKIYNTPFPAGSKPYLDGIDIQAIRKLVDGHGSGHLEPGEIQKVLDAAGIPHVQEQVVSEETSLEMTARSMGYPLVMKVVGPVHKSDVGGVALGIDNDIDLMDRFQDMLSIEGSKGVLLQPYVEGVELFAGAVYEPAFGHLIMCGIGGIQVEAVQDVATGLAPLSMTEASGMIHSLKGFKILEGYRGQPGINVEAYAEILVRLSSILRYATEIVELDLNPIMGKGNRLTVVDARIRIEKPVL
jgi:acetyltransferase